MAKHGGHLFVVRGWIGRFVCDASVISTDAVFRVEPHWHDVVSPDGGAFAADAHRPPHWSSQGWGRSRVNERVWFLDVTDHGEQNAQFERLRSVLIDIAGSGISLKVDGRPAPLIAIPVIGIRGGGLSQRRGEVLDRLLATCRSVVDEHDVDIAIVAASAASYAALQHQRRLNREAYFPGQLLVDGDGLAEAERLGAAAKNGSLALFIGAGTSVPAGAPTWQSLIGALATKAGLGAELKESFEKLSPLDQAELVQQRLKTDGLAAGIKEEIGQRRPAVAHLLLAALGCQSTVTTNYDDLYEQAVQSSGGIAVTVLPAEIPRPGTRWILKMHGDLSRPESIVLTRGQFVGFTSVAGPSGAVLQTLLLTKHLLVVGTSMTDDNVLRLIHEVTAYRRSHRAQKDLSAENDTLGTLLEVGNDPARRELHRSQFEIDQLAGSELQERARSLEVFLDAVAMHASSDSSWLLDPTFEFLLDAPSRDLAERLRAIAQEVRSTGRDGDAWSELADRMDEFGAELSTTRRIRSRRS